MPHIQLSHPVNLIRQTSYCQASACTNLLMIICLIAACCYLEPLYNSWPCSSRIIARHGKAYISHVVVALPHMHSMQDLSPILPSPTAQDFGQESLRRAVRQCITDLAQRVGDSLHLLEALGGVVGKLQGFNPLTTAVLECVAEAALAVNYFSPKVCPFCGADMLCIVNSITRPSCMCLHFVSVTPCNDSWHRGGEEPSSLDNRHLTRVCTSDSMELWSDCAISTDGPAYTLFHTAFSYGTHMTATLHPI